MNKGLFFFLLMFIVLLQACTEDQTDYVIPNVTSHVSVVKPTPELGVKDAQSAIAKNDFRFLMAYNLGTYIPGIKIDPYILSLVRKNGVIGLSGTGDSFKNEAEKQFNDVVVVYAEKYNETILSAITSRSE